MFNRLVRFRIPPFNVIFFIFGSIITVPWTIYLSQSLPTRHTFRHWDIAWVGLDILLIASLLITGVLTYLKSLWVVIAASATSMLLLIDAWFDLTGAHKGLELHEAEAAALLFELPIAIISLHVAYTALKKAYRQ